jgi:dTDP-4-amino-4,6-dideoxygalactose transaminase
MNKNSFQIPQPKKIKVASITPFWRFRDYFDFFYNILFKNSEQLKLNISQSIKNIHNIDFDFSYFFDSGKSAIYFSLLALGLSKGDKVIIPSFTCRAVLFALFEAKVEPILMDIDDDYNLDLLALSALNDLEGIKAIILPNMYGKINSNYKLINKIKRKGIIVIEDNATSFGSTYSSEIISDAVIYSFNTGKMINGSGGGIVFLRNKVNSSLLRQVNDSQMSKVLIRFIRNLITLRYRKKLSPIINLIRDKNKNQLTLDDYYSVKDQNINKVQKYFNCKNVSLFNLSLVDSQLRSYEKVKFLYIDLFQKYNSKLELSSRLNHNEMPNYFVLEIDKKINRYALGSFLSSKGIEVFWSYFPIHKIQIYKDIKFIGSLAATNKKWSNFLYMPFNVFVKETDVELVCNLYKNFVSKCEHDK